MEWVPDLRQLRALLAVAEEGSFTLAARKLFVTQSAVSHSLRTLEEQLGCRLLDRTGKRVSVTTEGGILLRRCKRVVRELEEATRELDGLRRWGQTTIRVGAPHSLCHSMIPSVLREFRDCFPRCEPSVESGETPALLEKVSEVLERQMVEIEVQGADGRGLVFAHTLVRVAPGTVTEMHIDTDEANAAGISGHVDGAVVPHVQAVPRV
jgi:molybdenum-dependent DNA-binding transcriptional regulator ModE